MMIKHQRMLSLIRFIKWLSITAIAFTVIGYNGFVQWRYSKLPEDRSPSKGQFSDRVKEVYWQTVFGPDPMKMHSYPLWRVLTDIPLRIVNKRKKQPSFEAATAVSRRVILAKSPEQHSSSIDGHLNQLFMAIWVSKYWTAEDAVNTLLSESYFCHEFYGIEDAAMGFFGQSVNELTNEELVFLAGISSRPCWFSPWSYPEKAKRHAEVLLDRATKMGVLNVKNDANECFKRLLSQNESKMLRK